jgi:cardiolipin synthase
LTRAGYRALLEAGVRIFEWNGTMVHAKTAVADGRWARVGSTNLNIQSWLGNWELDVAVENEDFAHQMEDVYQNDLENATEIVLTESRVTSTGPEPSRRKSSGPGPWRRRGTGRTRRAAAAGALRMGRTFGAALTARRALGATELVTLVWGAVLLVGLGAISIKWPRGIAYPLGVLLFWLAVSWLLQAIKAWRKRDRRARSLDRTAPRRIDAA